MIAVFTDASNYSRIRLFVDREEKKMHFDCCCPCFQTKTVEHMFEREEEEEKKNETFFVSSGIKYLFLKVKVSIKYI
jgi:hypothetical protein